MSPPAFGEARALGKRRSRGLWKGALEGRGPQGLLGIWGLGIQQFLAILGRCSCVVKVFFEVETIKIFGQNGFLASFSRLPGEDNEAGIQALSISFQPEKLLCLPRKLLSATANHLNASGLGSFTRFTPHEGNLRRRPKDLPPPLRRQVTTEQPKAGNPNAKAAAPGFKKYLISSTIPRHPNTF